MEDISFRAVSRKDCAHASKFPLGYIISPEKNLTIVSKKSAEVWISLISSSSNTLFICELFDST